ncbi:hypothetical protein BDF21DRAFT_466151 [Thamnidium elegans]|nr:hypothetical protein BDF21DRAFT_466151 [Thamnidium elegans]
MLACQRIAFAAKRQIHTAPAILAESEGLFGKFNPWANKPKTDTVTPAQHTNEETKVTFNVKYQEEDDIVSWKRTDVLTDPSEIESTVKSVILQHVSGANETNWNELPIQDLDTKFKVLKFSMKETGKEVPNYELNNLQTTNDVLQYFKEGRGLAIEDTTVQSYLEQNRESLPKNLTFIPRE